LKKSLFFIGLLFLFACAQQVAPTGGAKDEMPPRILESEPENQSVNFKAERIEIQFDEFVRLNRLNEQLITSPPLEYNLLTSIRGKTLRMEIQDTLKENTTYVFNFGNAIVDIRENNPIENYTYVFSTGDYIDSNQVSGRLINAFQGEYVKNALVMAYKVNDALRDSTPYLKKPDYLALTDDYGNFKLDYMQSGEYKLFALKEDNDNYVFDLLSEEIGFLDQYVNTADTLDSLNIYLFKEDHETQFIKEQKESGPSTQLIFNLPVDSFAFSTKLVDSLDLLPKKVFYSKQKDTIELWWPEIKMRFPLIIQADTLLDTIQVAIDTLKEGKLSPLRVKQFGPHRYFAPSKISFSQPIMSFDTAKIKLFDADSLQIPYSIDSTANGNEWLMNFEREEEAKYTVVFDSASFTDIYGFALDSTAFGFTMDGSDAYGSLAVNIKSDFQDQLILHLLDQRKKLLRKVVLKDNSHLFEHLKAGEYKLKLIIDRNGNCQWDTGNYIEGLQPEKVINYEGEIRIRNRWDKEVDWIIK
jgi:hypothetical protein